MDGNPELIERLLRQQAAGNAPLSRHHMARSPSFQAAPAAHAIPRSLLQVPSANTIPRDQPQAVDPFPMPPTAGTSGTWLTGPHGFGIYETISSARTPTGLPSLADQHDPMSGFSCGPGTPTQPGQNPEEYPRQTYLSQTRSQVPWQPYCHDHGRPQQHASSRSSSSVVDEPAFMSPQSSAMGNLAPHAQSIGTPPTLYSIVTGNTPAHPPWPSSQAMDRTLSSSSIARSASGQHGHPIQQQCLYGAGTNPFLQDQVRPGWEPGDEGPGIMAPALSALGSPRPPEMSRMASEVSRSSGLSLGLGLLFDLEGDLGVSGGQVPPNSAMTDIFGEEEVEPPHQGSGIAAAAPPQPDVQTRRGGRGLHGPKRRLCTICSPAAFFSGTHELQRHVRSRHESQRTVYICCEPTSSSCLTPLVPLNRCRSCRSGKKYNANYNAAAHLRRIHFNPRIPNRFPQKNQGRGGKAGGDQPPMTELRLWIKDVKDTIPSAGKTATPLEGDEGNISPDDDASDNGDDASDNGDDASVAGHAHETAQGSRPCPAPMDRHASHSPFRGSSPAADGGALFDMWLQQPHGTAPAYQHTPIVDIGGPEPSAPVFDDGPRYAGNSAPVVMSPVPHDDGSLFIPKELYWPEIFDQHQALDMDFPDHYLDPTDTDCDPSMFDGHSSFLI